MEFASSKETPRELGAATLCNYFCFVTGDVRIRSPLCFCFLSLSFGFDCKYIKLGFVNGLHDLSVVKESWFWVEHAFSFDWISFPFSVVWPRCIWRPKSCRAWFIMGMASSVACLLGHTKVPSSTKDTSLASKHSPLLRVFASG